MKYTAWLLGRRHLQKQSTSSLNHDDVSNRQDAARAAAAISGGKTGSRKMEMVIAALLSEPTYAAVASKVGVGESTLYRWMKLPKFRDAFERAKKEMAAAALGRLQAASGEAVEALKHIATKGRREGDRVRAANALLEYAFKGFAMADLFKDPPNVTPDAPAGTADIVKVLTTRLSHLESAALPTPEKTRLTVSIADALLRAIGVDVIEKRLAALEGVLGQRKGKL